MVRHTIVVIGKALEDRDRMCVERNFLCISCLFQSAQSHPCVDFGENDVKLNSLFY